MSGSDQAKENSRAEKSSQTEKESLTVQNENSMEEQSGQTEESSRAKKEHRLHGKRFHVLRIVLLAIVGVLIGVNVYLWNAESLVGNRLPMPFGYGAAVVLSGSMEPALSVGDLVIVRETETVSEGDVIIYVSGSELIIHRVIAVDGEEILTQGDANAVSDAPITMDAVKGVLVLAVPKAGKLVQLLKQPWMVVLILVAAFGLMELSNRREKARDKEELAQLEAEISALTKELSGGARDEEQKSS